MNKPNFFIVGMPRAGTTSLYHYLADHPEIFMSADKEPHFFGSDLTRGELFRRPDENRYLSLFSEASNEKILGEASVDYLTSTKAAEEIHHFNPQSRILISLRNPVDQCYSYYCKHRLNDLEPAKTFAEAIDDSRIMLAPSRWTKEGLEYKKNIRNLPDNIRRFLAVFGQEKVKIIFFEDLQQHTAATYKEILRFLNVNPDFAPSFKIHNVHRIARVNWLNHLYWETVPLKNWPRLKKQLKRIYMDKAWRWLYSLSLTKPEFRPTLQPALRESLMKEFLPVVNELESITGHNLTAWKRV